MNRLQESSRIPLKSKSGKVLGGLFAEFDTFNENGRKYPGDIYKPALSDIMNKIREGRLLGECDHPDYDEVRLSNVSHVIRGCEVRGNKVYGEVELLDTPAGKIVQSLHEAGIPIGISSRGVGNTRTTSEGTVVTDLKLITFDLVADPSFSNAILTEGKKVTLIGNLSSIEKELPLNESVESFSIRSTINRLRESIESAPTITDSLIESIGDLTVKLHESNSKLQESAEIKEDLQKRYKSVSSKMLKLQESYTSLKERTDTVRSNNKILKESIKGKDKSISLLESEVIELRKELAIETRGLSKSSMLPLLEGLTTVDEIESKLNSIKQLGTRKRSGIGKDLNRLTEGVNTKTEISPLAKLVSSV